MLRPSLFAAALAAVALQAHAAEFGVARPGGVYATLPATDADACARLCAADGLCMAWTLRAGACELKATAPDPVADTSATSGLSTRAPALARLVPLPTNAPESVKTADTDSQTIILATATAVLPPDDGALLGGPDSDEVSSRSRLGSSP